MPRDHARMLEVEHETLRLAGPDLLTDSVDLGDVHALVRADHAQSVGANVENPLGPEVDRFAFVIDEDGPDRAGSRSQKPSQDGLKRQSARRRLAPVLRSGYRRA